MTDSQKLDRIMQEQRLHRELLLTVLSATNNIEQQETDMAKKLSDFVTDLTARIEALKVDVAEGKTVNASVIALMNGLQAEKAALKTQLQELIDAGGDPATVAKLQTIVDGIDEQDAALDANKQELADLVTANTDTPPVDPTARK